MPPFMMGYLGVTRKQKLCLAAAAGVSALVGFGLLMGPLVARFGPVRVLRMSLAIAAVVPLAISAAISSIALLLACSLPNQPPPPPQEPECFLELTSTNIPQVAYA
eukprot:g30193.t1